MNPLYQVVMEDEGRVVVADYDLTWEEALKLKDECRCEFPRYLVYIEAYLPSESPTTYH